MAYKVLITHPERQHSHELAGALHSRGRLGAYIHGAPISADMRQSIPRPLRTRIGFCRLGRRILQPVLPARFLLESYYRMIWMFDALVARRLHSARCDAVVAYENAALYEFRAAKALGMACILDNAGVHHALQDRMLAYRESATFHRCIVARKDEELALADLILVCSSFAAESFVAGGISPSKLRVVPLGCDTSAFRPCTAEIRQSGEPIRFLFVGRINRLKGADLLAQAAGKLRADKVAFTLSVVAPLAEAEDELAESLADVAVLRDKVAHETLPAIHAEADCLILPSRFDSFALVVAEGLASGLPVIVSDHVGAKDMVARGENGWIFRSGDLNALCECMRWCAENVETVRAMRPAARATAEAWGWARYHAQALATVDQFMTNWQVEHEKLNHLEQPFGKHLEGGTSVDPRC